MRAREQSVGLDADDAAAAWLDENAPKEAVQPPKSRRKSKLLHQWKRAQRKR
jgi:hypothetical protein